MKKSFIIYFTILCFSISSSGQTNDYILTNQQATKWFDSLKLLQIDAQLKMLSDRLLLDTNVFVVQNFISLRDPKSIEVVPAGKVESKITARPLLIINNKQLIAITNSTSTQKIIKLSELILSIPISGTSFLDGNSAAGLYGKEGACGVIILTLTRDEDLRKFKKLKISKN